MSSFVLPAALMLALVAPGAAAPLGPPAGIWQQLTIRQRIVVRVPRMPVPAEARMPAADIRPIRWEEKNGPKCIAVETLAAATITESDSVDLVVRGGSRLRAKLGDNCPALDFYSGVYLKRTSDGKLCVRRDSIRSRSGDACPIVALKRLVPAR
ncbi:hypothetical protein ACFO8O_06330 [Hephaestia sp. GCM10023244]|uniref:hypothetical protein n=1 Tax=unclassified Hephaestia TaxID=2631281 RepID=UPI002076D8AE|nr:hypothetical protein [Hephaestia sp. MAHUQ-44]MCM8730585.1 hypothetical protein [Hephaestia sp. MAHUQ-44]